jgi:predicted  nucleic acid-binding Zn-ribbon protein
VHEQIELLKALRELDHELNSIRQQRRELEKEQAELNSEKERIQIMVDGLDEEIDKLQSQQAELQQGLAQEESNIQRSEERLPEIKTQKEYLAVLKEIDATKKMTKDLTAQCDEKLARIADLQAEKEEKLGQLEELKARSEARGNEITEALGACDKMLEEKAGQRSTHFDPLPKQLQKRYALLMERRGGVAVVEARDGNCTGCHMHLPPQLFNSLFLEPQIQSCPHCNRLLFVTGRED